MIATATGLVITRIKGAGGLGVSARLLAVVADVGWQCGPCETEPGPWRLVHSYTWSHSKTAGWAVTFQRRGFGGRKGQDL